MKSKWETKTLGEVCEKGSSNVSLNKIQDNEGNYPIYGAKGFLKKVDFYHQDKPYISIIKDGAGVGRVNLQEAKSSVIGTLQYILPKEKIDIHFLYYFLLGIDFNKYSCGAAIPHIYFKDYEKEEIKVPSLKEQKAIVKILDQTFKSISKSKENAEKNLKNAKELFESYLEEIFSNPKEDWEEKRLGEIANVEYGFTGKAKSTGDFRYVRITDIDNDGLLIENNKLYLKKSKEAKKFILNNEDLVMARTGATYAKVLFYQDTEPSVFASYLIRIKFNKNILNKLYWYFSKSRNYWNQANSLSSGSAQPHFNGHALKEVVFNFPKEINQQKIIVQKLDALSKEIKELESIYKQKIKDLEELKKSMLQKAFSGNLTKE